MRITPLSVLVVVGLLASQSGGLAQPKQRDDHGLSLEALVSDVTDVPLAGRCGLPLADTGQDVKALVREYQRTRQLASDTVARELVTALLNYMNRRPGSSREELLRQHVRAGASPLVADDIIGCTLNIERTEQREVRIRQVLEVPPAGVGLFWAARMSERPEDKWSYYQRALAADPGNPRTRLFYAIDLVAADRGAPALRLLDSIPAGWAPDSVRYWRGRALIAMKRWREARAVLAHLPPVFKRENTTPEIWSFRDPVRGDSPRLCALYLAMGASGEMSKALASLRNIPGCARELGQLSFMLNQPFDALVAAIGGHSHLDIKLEALARLGSCEWARDYLARLTETRWDRVRAIVTARCPIDTPTVPVDTRVAQRVAAPRLTAFVEQPLPAKWTSGRDVPSGRLSTSAYPSLKPFTVVALSPTAERMFAVSISDALDPGGEVHSGGYWLHLSVDRGRHWEGPYYLGLTEAFPYLVKGTSRVPPFVDGRMLVEVVKAPIDRASVTLPPLRLRLEDAPRPLILSFDLDEVRRDSDGDGLTDLLEDKLLLNPRVSDSDGDGLGDRDDPLPLLKQDGERSFRDKLLWKTLLARRRTRQEKSPIAMTLFVRAVRCPVPHMAGVRTICIPPQLFDRYEDKFGTTFPLTPQIAFDGQHRRAVIDMNGGWTGRTELATWKDGAWTLKTLTSWIT